MKKLVSKLVSNLLVGISVVLLIWFVISYGEILIKHDGPNPEYSDKNVIIKVVEWACDYYGYDY